mmetsp:Transcript_10126/g.17110  ORF Transcript_10126/g.17110 Transcript_10126/m.17110 type:complete len:424 (-) Transcript_10126:706-1977(-)
MRIGRQYTATALGVCLVAVISITDSVVSAVQSSSSSSNGRGIFGSRRLPWNLSSTGSTSSSSSVHNNNNDKLSTRGGAAAARTSIRRQPMKGASSSSPPVKKGGVKKMKKMVKKQKQRAATTNNAKGDVSSPNKDTMPSIFRIPSEEKYDRYAAALAITEGLRRIRDADVARAEKVYKKTPRQARRNNSPSKPTTTDTTANATSTAQPEPSSPKEILDQSKQQAESAFLLQSTKAVKSLGMTVAQFNQIGREVLSDPALKERVSEQAYLYRIHASAMSLDKVPLLSSGDNTDDNENEDVLKNHKRHQVQMFARSIQEIEDLRTDQLNQLQSQLRMTQFPPNFDLSDPNVQPLLREEVRAVCERFPAKAEEIVKRYGLESEEFNKMLEETRGNPIFRWRVMKTVRGVEEERRKKKERKDGKGKK